MSDTNASIRIPVDLTNPGQFFACCGLLELADRLWGGAEAWFERRHFCISTEDRSNTLTELLTETRALVFDVGDDAERGEEAENDDKMPVDPIQLHWKQGTPAILLDWWSEKSIKPWAGSMNERIILRAMLDSIDPVNADPFSDLRRVQYQSPKRGKNGKLKKAQKKEPFYFDPRRGNKSHPLDCGFSPDTHKMDAECCPTLEALCFVGLQRARPAPTGVANQSRYSAWPRISVDAPGLPPSIVGAMTNGAIRVPGSTNFVFKNYFRTDHRKHKTFSVAQIERNQHG
jgi:CRISPR-associated protein Csb3